MKLRIGRNGKKGREGKMREAEWRKNCIGEGFSGRGKGKGKGREGEVKEKEEGKGRKIRGAEKRAN